MMWLPSLSALCVISLTCCALAVEGPQSGLLEVSTTEAVVVTEVASQQDAAVTNGFVSLTFKVLEVPSGRAGLVGKSFSASVFPPLQAYADVSVRKAKLGLKVAWKVDVTEEALIPLETGSSSPVWEAAEEWRFREVTALAAFLAKVARLKGAELDRLLMDSVESKNWTVAARALLVLWTSAVSKESGRSILDRAWSNAAVRAGAKLEIDRISSDGIPGWAGAPQRWDGLQKIAQMELDDGEGALLIERLLAGQEQSEFPHLKEVRQTLWMLVDNVKAGSDGRRLAVLALQTKATTPELRNAFIERARAIVGGNYPSEVKDGVVVALMQMPQEDQDQCRHVFLSALDKSQQVGVRMSAAGALTGLDRGKPAQHFDRLLDVYIKEPMDSGLRTCAGFYFTSAALTDAQKSKLRATPDAADLVRQVDLLEQPK
jgi:hypothetical protein